MLSHTGRCYARVGLLGNPSDGFEGKTLGFELKNFFAEVIIRPSDRVIIHPHPDLDPTSFGSMEDLHAFSEKYGYYGGLRLVQATVKKFFEYFLISRRSGRSSVGETGKAADAGFEVFYSTNIPRMVGLSGSSAIVLATFRALQSFFSLTLEELRISGDEFACVILNIERSELSISGGLQDRVIQVYGGLVHMDFTSAATAGGFLPGAFTPLDQGLLPKLYLVYDEQRGGDSGKVHSTVQDRWRSREPSLVEGMVRLGTLADQGLDALMGKDYVCLGRLMAMNFAIRRQLYSDAVVGERYIDLVELLAGHGLTAKFTGSGGALVCIRTDGQNAWLDADQEVALADMLSNKGHRLVQIEV